MAPEPSFSRRRTPPREKVAGAIPRFFPAQAFKYVSIYRFDAATMAGLHFSKKTRNRRQRRDACGLDGSGERAINQFYFHGGSFEIPLPTERTTPFESRAQPRRVVCDSSTYATASYHLVVDSVHETFSHTYGTNLQKLFRNRGDPSEIP